MKISAAEGRVMEVLWAAERPMAAEDVVEALSDSAEWTPGTVRTLLTRLVKKKALGVTQDGKRYLYRPLVERSDYVTTETRGLLDRLFGGELTPLVHHFAQQGELTPKELAKLKALIAEVEKKHG